MKSPSKFVIVGTAGSWAMAPWEDGAAYIASLNDAYQIGIPRAEAWYDMHPFEKFFFPNGKPLRVEDVPAGTYLRPKGHLEWLQNYPGTLWCHQAPEGWDRAKTFPKAEVEAYFGCYFTSTPAWMMAHAILEGYRHIEVYGIHLATDAEWAYQRPQMEFLCGRFLGRGRLTITVKDGLRHYETEDAHLVFPSVSPVLRSNFQYAFEMRPTVICDPLRARLGRLMGEKTRVLEALIHLPWWKGRTALKAELLAAAVEEAQVRQQITREESRIKMEEDYHVRL